MNNQDISVIENWIEGRLKTAKALLDDDIHVDEINEKYTIKKNWVQLSLDLVSIAHSFLEKNHKHIRCLVCIPLESDDEKEIGFRKNSIYEVWDELNVTPPSLMIFNESDYSEIISHRSKIETITYLDLPIDSFYYEEYSESSNGYVRNIFLIPIRERNNRIL